MQVHHSQLVKAWVAGHGEKIELFHLLNYSPQLNLEERLNADLKQEMGKHVPVRTKAKLRAAVSEHMAMLEQNPERVIGYFQDSPRTLCHLIFYRAGSITRQNPD